MGVKGCEIGEVYHMLTALEKAPSRTSPSGQTKSYWVCLCECGETKEVRGAHLRSGYTKCCGCVKPGKRTHGGAGSRLYNIWCSMKQRCYNPNCSSYRWWGRIGVTICDEWLNDFANFREWALSNGYKDNLTIDRVRNANIYSPDTCEWVTIQENVRRRDEMRGL